MGNERLQAAKVAKNDEFYTRYEDIENEMREYHKYNPDVFRGKRILCPCDDPEWSNFTKFFAARFSEWGIKKLVSTSYAIESKKYKTDYTPSLFEQKSTTFDSNKTRTHGKIFVLENDKTGDGKIDIDDLDWQYLAGDGDFRSEEITRLRDEADIIITNPPFSLFREFLLWITSGENKKFSIIGNMNAITYKETFPLIKDNKIWIGATSMMKELLFTIPKSFEEQFLKNGKEGSKYRIIDGVVYGRSLSTWFTNLEHGRKHTPLKLMTSEDIFRYSKHRELRERKSFDYYDNYDAIEVPFTDSIPSDYEGVMGVPVSFLDKYCPEQFEILGAGEDNGSGFAGDVWKGGDQHCLINGRRVYKRILIRRRKRDALPR